MRKLLKNKLSKKERESLAKDDASMIIILKSIKKTKQTFKQKESEYLEKTREYKRLKRYFIVKEFKNKIKIFKHAVFWSLKLLTPDSIIGYPSFDDNLELFLMEKKFFWLRLAWPVWLIFFVFAVLAMNFFYYLVIIGAVLFILTICFLWKAQINNTINKMGIKN